MHSSDSSAGAPDTVAADPIDLTDVLAEEAALGEAAGVRHRALVEGTWTPASTCVRCALVLDRIDDVVPLQERGEILLYHAECMGDLLVERVALVQRIGNRRHRLAFPTL